MNKRIPYILISGLILSVGETALAQVKVEESISTKALVKRGSRDVLRTGVIDLSRGHYRDSLVNYFTIQQGTGDEVLRNVFTNSLKKIVHLKSSWTIGGQK